MSFMRKCHLSISVVSCPQKLFIQVLGGYSPRQIHLFIYHLRASRQIKPGCIITGKFDLLETLLCHCEHKLTKQNLHLSCVFKNNLTPWVAALLSSDDSFNHPWGAHLLYFINESLVKGLILISIQLQSYEYGNQFLPDSNQHSQQLRHRICVRWYHWNQKTKDLCTPSTFAEEMDRLPNE